MSAGLDETELAERTMADAIRARRVECEKEENLLASNEARPVTVFPQHEHAANISSAQGMNGIDADFGPDVASGFDDNDVGNLTDNDRSRRGGELLEAQRYEDRC